MFEAQAQAQAQAQAEAEAEAEAEAVGGSAEPPGGASSAPSIPPEELAGGSRRAELAELPLERLEHEITQLAAHINAGMCRWLELVAEFDRREGWGRHWGVRSSAEWVAWRCGLAPRAAREHVRVARRLRELPVIHRAFSHGELSYAKVRAITRVAEPETEAELLDLARKTTAAQLERIVRGLRRISSDDANALHAQRRLEVLWEPDGSLYIRGSLPPEEGALFLRALEAARDLLYERSQADEGGTAADPDSAGEAGSAEPRFAPGSAEPPPEGSWITNADALAAMADLSLSSHASERSGAERYQVLIHVDEEGHPVLEDGSALSPETVRRLACEASVVRLRGSPGSGLSVGRRTRSIPAALQRALEARDPTCRFPGCERRRFLDSPHLHHWAHGGETSAENLVRLCRHHHRLVHEGGFSVAAAAGRLTFRRPDGEVLANGPRGPRGDRRALVERNRRAGLEIDHHTCDGGLGEKLDLDWTLATWPQRLLPRSAR